MRSQQRGITLIGWIILLVPLAVVVYAGIRLTPVYLNYMKVARSLDQVASEVHGGETTNSGTLRNALEKHLDIESVDYPTLKDIKISKDGRGWLLEAAYDDQAPLFYNIFILVSFDKAVHIGGSGAGD
jgi:hypothetical protein